MNALPTHLLKPRVRSTIDYVAQKLGVLKLCERRMRTSLTILMYHRVLPEHECRNYPLESLVVPDQAFEEQVNWLQHHCRVLPVREALLAFNSAGNAASRRPIVALTFDDGYLDNYNAVAPMLERRDMRATFFVTTGFVAKGGPLWFDQAAHVWKHLSAPVRRDMIHLFQQERLFPQSINVPDAPDVPWWMQQLKQLPFVVRQKCILAAAENAAHDLNYDLFQPMQPEHLRKLAKVGHEIAGHTVNHPILTQLDDRRILHELAHSRATLQNWTDDSIQGLCYPNGNFNSRVLRLATQLGYRYACTTRPGVNGINSSPMQLKRVAITQRHVLNSRRGADTRAFRSEVCQFRQWMRQTADSGWEAATDVKETV